MRLGSLGGKAWKRDLVAWVGRLGNEADVTGGGRS